MNINQYISVDPEICHGKPVFTGSRIPVSLILELFEAGESIETIVKQYPTLKKQQIGKALHIISEQVDRSKFYFQ